ncbi:MAG: hypothetical protein PVH61_15420 [Candidatus Aminicenantes bacterium]|jgi:hypothetical protein
MKLSKSFCGVQGRFFQKKPLAAGGNKSNFMVVAHDAAGLARRRMKILQEFLRIDIRGNMGTGKNGTNLRLYFLYLRLLSISSN